MATRKGNGQQDRRRAQTAHQNRRRRRRKRNRALHYIILLIFLLGGAAVLSTTVLFKIEEVEVFGVDKYTPDEVIAATGVQPEDNLLRIDKKEMERNLLETFPYIREVEIRRKLPPRVEITVVQTTPMAAIPKGDELLLVDEGGKVLERGTILVPEEVLVVKGIDPEDAKPGDVLGRYTEPRLASGEKLPEEEQKKKDRAEAVRERLVMVRYLLAAMEESEFTSLTNVDVTDRLNMRILYENRITLELGSENELPYKLGFIKLVLENYISPDASGVINATEPAKRRLSFLQEGGSTVELFEADELDSPEETTEENLTPEDGEESA